MTRPIQASLDLQVMKQNLAIVRRAAPEARVWSVVKANAYGHGIERVWSALGATDGFQNARLNAPLDIYVKVNSGMNRLGRLERAGRHRWFRYAQP